MKIILAPIDFSPVSDAVAAEAAALARALGGQVVLLTTTQSPLILAEYSVQVDNLDEIAIAAEKNAARQLAKFEEKLQADFVPVESLQFVGHPVEHIVEQAKKLEADYVVMGSHGHTAFYDLLVGSTTHGVMLRVKCPVVIVPAHKAAAARKTEKELHAVA